jgi:hypothetical protein
MYVAADLGGGAEQAPGAGRPSSEGPDARPKDEA